MASRRSFRKKSRKSVRKSARKSARKAARKSARKSVRKAVRRSLRKIARGGALPVSVWTGKEQCKTIFKSAETGKRKPVGYSRCKLLHPDIYSTVRGDHHRSRIGGPWFDTPEIRKYTRAESRSRRNAELPGYPLVPMVDTMEKGKSEDPFLPMGDLMEAPNAQRLLQALQAKQQAKQQARAQAQQAFEASHPARSLVRALSFEKPSRQLERSSTMANGEVDGSIREAAAERRRAAADDADRVWRSTQEGSNIHKPRPMDHPSVDSNDPLLQGGKRRPMRLRPRK